MNEWIQFALFFLAITGALLALMALLGRRRSGREDRLRLDEEPPGPSDLVFGKMTPALAGQLPMSGRTQGEVQKELRLAGYYRPTAILEYKAVRALLVLLPLFATGAAALLVPPDDVQRVLLFGGIAVGLGYSIPRVYLTLRGRARSREIERALPLAVDLLTLCLTAGQNLLDALRQVSEELHFSHPVVARELAIAQRHASLHSLENAMQQWANRNPIPEVTNLALLLIQSERLGTDAASTLLEFAGNLRVTLRQRAEAQANRTSFWMLFPSVFCFWIAAAIILIAPPYLEFFQYRNQAAQLFKQSRNNITRANETRTPQPPAAEQKGPEQLAPGR
jgi:pilus assembly protein TadC